MIRLKHILLFLLPVILFSCNKNPAEKPKHLLDEKEMVDIFYDLAVLQAMKSYRPQDLTYHKVNTTQYIYEKYGIDSTTFFQNHRYYASDLKEYKKIQDMVDDRLKKEKDRYAPKKETIKKKPADKAAERRAYDSIRAIKRGQILHPSSGTPPVK